MVIFLYNLYIFCLVVQHFCSPPNSSGGVLSVICVSVCLSYVLLFYIHPYFHFWMISWINININKFSPNLVHILIMWRSGLGLLSVICPSVHPYFHFQMIICVNINGFSPNGMCIDVVEIWFGIVNGQISSIFVRGICPPQDSGGVLSFCIFIML